MAGWPFAILLPKAQFAHANRSNRVQARSSPVLHTEPVHRAHWRR